MNKILILDLNEKKNSIFKMEFIEPICNILKENNFIYEVKHFKEEYNPNHYTKIILSGVPLKDFSYESYISNFEWIETFNKPVLGICSGGQVIVKIFNGDILKKKEIGIIKLNKIQNDNILINLEDNFEAYSLHKKTFLTPNGFDVLLENDSPQLIKAKNKNIYACSFHPEIKNKIIIENFLKL